MCLRVLLRRSKFCAAALRQRAKEQLAERLFSETPVTTSIYAAGPWLAARRRAHRRCCMRPQPCYLYSPSAVPPADCKCPPGMVRGERGQAVRPRTHAPFGCVRSRGALGLRPSACLCLCGECAPQRCRARAATKACAF
jgi:hypothetical protein